MMKPNVSVVIPTLNASEEIRRLLDILLNQRICPNEILIIDSSSSDETVGIAKEYPSVRVKIIERSDFDHGRTRNSGIDNTTGEFILFLTQDAIPKDSSYIDRLLAPFKDESVALSYGRQIPKDDASRFIQLIQEYNYSHVDSVRDFTAIKTMGIKAFFCSDVCSAYRRVALEQIGGIPHPCSTNEDMLAAARFLNRGYRVAYCSSAEVYHSHNFSLRDQFNRNVAVGAFLELNKDELNVESEIGEGGKLVRFVLKSLIAENNYSNLINFIFDCAARLIGNRVGRIKAKLASRELEQ